MTCQKCMSYRPDGFLNKDNFQCPECGQIFVLAGVGPGNYWEEIEDQISELRDLLTWEVKNGFDSTQTFGKITKRRVILGKREKTLDNKQEMRNDIAKHFIRPSDGECWIWQGLVDEYGYGVYKCQGQSFHAHRSAAIIFGKRAVMPGTVLTHTCGNKLCCNPWHIRIRDGLYSYDCMGEESMIEK